MASNYTIRDNDTNFILRNLPGAKWNDGTHDKIIIWRFADPNKGAGPRAMKALKEKGYENIEFIFFPQDKEEELLAKLEESIKNAQAIKMDPEVVKQVDAEVKLTATKTPEELKAEKEKKAANKKAKKAAKDEEVMPTEVTAQEEEDAEALFADGLNAKCMSCTRACKQSVHVELVRCPQYKKIETKKDAVAKKAKNKKAASKKVEDTKPMPTLPALIGQIPVIPFAA